MVVLPEIADLVPALAELTARLGSRKAVLGLHVTAYPNGFDLVVDGAKPLQPDDLPALAAWARAAGVVRLTLGGETVLQEAAPRLTFGAASVTPPPGGFLQATGHAEAALQAAVDAATGGARHVVDLFGGCGTLGLPLTTRAAVDLFDAEAEAVAAAAAGWRRAGGLHAFAATARDLFRIPLLPEDLARYDAAVIDPPRAGAEAQTRALAASGIPVIAAVSCNPTTFARDARLLIDGGFRLDWIDVVDQFRWSPHVEVAARFERD
ncbi:MAG: hypothetical protein ACU0CO_12165 [Shimia sp.]